MEKNLIIPTLSQPKIIPQSLEIIRVKNIWIANWCSHTKEIIFRRIVEKSHFYNHNQIITFEHYINISELHPNYINITPNSHSCFLYKCKGCHLSERNIYNQNPSKTCYISIPSNTTFIIHTSKSNLTFPQYDKPIYKCVKQYPTLKQTVIIDYNRRNNSTNETVFGLEETLLHDLVLINTIELKQINHLNRNLILQLILPVSLHSNLLQISLKLCLFTTLVFYTDGSLSRDEEIPIIGYG
ncbi:hypothetical protein C1646_750314 [Rhizophagus diaphanus]|nr:hypothetical protein C1646_750314 [Rhizophagus diaphanus] [Rhizophagus sp. MUCL 43196]